MTNLALLLAFAGAITVNGQALMGIDFGSDSVKVATIKNSEFSIVLNEASQRKTKNALGFDGDVRIFGAMADNLRGRLPKAVIQHAHHLLGAKADAPVTKTFGSSAMPVPLVTAADGRGGSAFNIGAPVGQLTPEEVVGHSIHYLAEMTKAYGKHGDVQSCVVAVPPHFTAQARSSLIAAADIAGIRVLHVVNDNAAVAVKYAQDRKPGSPDEKVLFIDVGASFTSASVAEFTTVKNVPRITIKAVAWDEELGGQQFDIRLAEFLADEFDKVSERDSQHKHSTTPRTHSAFVVGTATTVLSLELANGDLTLLSPSCSKPASRSETTSNPTPSSSPLPGRPSSP